MQLLYLKKFKVFIFIFLLCLLLTTINHNSFARSGGGGNDNYRTPANYQSKSSLQQNKLDASEILNSAYFTIEKIAFSNLTKNDFASAIVKAKAILIFPDITAGGLVFFGAKHGSGVLLIKSRNKFWSYPSFYNISGLSMGLLVGMKSSAMVIIITDTKQLIALLKNNLNIGGSISAAIGGGGQGLSKDVSSKVITIELNKGLYIGGSLNGSYISEDKEYNNAFYGSWKANTKNIIFKGMFKNKQANRLRQLLKHYAK